MNYQSVCDWMSPAAATLPNDKNIKLFMRHSIRFDNPVNGDYSHLLLTPEGIKIANKIGESIDIPIGHFYASPVKRCQQTALEIARGAKIEDPEIITAQEYAYLLGATYAFDTLKVGWYEYYHSLQNDILDKTGGYTGKEVASKIIDRIFEDTGEPGTLDIICSHDGHVVALAGALFDLKTGLKGDNWCGFTEGIFFYGERDDFTAVWRGVKKRFINW